MCSSCVQICFVKAKHSIISPFKVRACRKLANPDYNLKGAAEELGQLVMAPNPVINNPPTSRRVSNPKMPPATPETKTLKPSQKLIDNVGKQKKKPTFM